MPSSQNKKWGTIAVGSLVLIALSLSFGNLNSLSGLVGDFVGIISSVLFGLVFAYMMNPIMVVVEKQLYRLMSRRNVTERAARKWSRGIGIAVSLIVLILAVYALVMLIVPQLVESLQKLLAPANLDNYKNKIDGWISKIVAGSRFEDAYQANSDRIFENVQKWLTNFLLNESTLLDAAQWAVSAVTLVVNALIGIVVAIYVLAYKDTFRAQSKKLVVALFKKERANRIIGLAQESNKLFTGFLVGKLIDSIIVGIICYVGMIIMGMPYTALISVIIGITNMIPFFGPLIGMVPSTLIILVEDPMTAFYFLIFVLVLQQVDGNIIGPRILGETVGISDFWILVSITVFGGLFGLAGMILGVPVFGVIYMLISNAVNGALAKKHQPQETKLYQEINRVEDLHPSAPEKEEDEPFEMEYDPDEELFEETDDIDI